MLRVLAKGKKTWDTKSNVVGMRRTDAKIRVCSRPKPLLVHSIRI